MAYEEILYEVADGVATLTLNRAARLNAWTPKMEAEVQSALLSADQDEAVRVVIVTGARRGFCAGADIDSLSMAAGASAEQLEAALRARFAGPKLEGAREDFTRMHAYWPALSKPIIAAINGAAAGIGLAIALYCDIRFASQQAKFTTAFSRRGLVAEHGISWLLPRVVGVAHALDLLLSARVVTAEEALAMGLVNRVIPHEQFMDEVRRYAADLAANVSPRSMRVIKRQVYNALMQDLGQAIDEANEAMLASFSSEDFREGVAHFVEKRPARFTGR